MSVILLARQEPRCRPTEPCMVKARCARNLAPLQGASIYDYSLVANGGTALCPGFYTPAQAREDAGRAYAAEAKARIEAARSKR